MTPVEIRALRTKLGMTLNEFGRGLKVTEMTVKRWENGYTTALTRRHRLALKRIAYLSDHLLARRAKPDWSL